MSHKMKFLDLNRVHTKSPKWRTKTMPIKLPKTTQNSPEIPQYPNNISQKYNHDPIHVSSSNLIFKCLKYNRKPNWYKILNRKHQALIKNTPDNSQICIVQPKGKLCMSLHMQWNQTTILSLPRNLQTPILGSPSPQVWQPLKNNKAMSKNQVLAST